MEQLLWKLRRIASTQCSSRLEDMMSNYKCFEVCCALERITKSNDGGDVVLWEDLNPDLKDAIGLPQRDVGIDYISTSLTFAGQAKLYSSGSYVSASDINRTLLCMYHAKDTNTKSGVMVDGCELATSEGVKLGRCAFGMSNVHHVIVTTERMKYWYERALALVPPIAQPQTTEPPLRGCQLKALENIHKGRINRIRMSCGSGKTRVAKEVLFRGSSAGTHLILVPYITLLEQWNDYLNEVNGMGSPIHIAKIVLIGTGYESIGHQNEVRTNDTKQCNADMTIVICVYNSHKKAFDKYGSFDWVVVDEAHHLEYADGGTGTYGELWDAVGTQSSVLLLSASLDTVDNDVHYNYTLRDAIEDGVCCDYDLRCSFFDGIGPSMESIAKYIDDHREYLSVMAYCNTIAAARELERSCLEIGVAAASISCEESKRERADIIKRFEEGKIRVISSVNTLGEGIDLRNADTCLFAEPRSSAISINQCIGRVVRRCEGKSMGHVVVCTSIDME